MTRQKIRRHIRRFKHRHYRRFNHHFALVVVRQNLRLEKYEVAFQSVKPAAGYVRKLFLLSPAHKNTCDGENFRIGKAGRTVRANLFVYAAVRLHFPRMRPPAELPDRVAKRELHHRFRNSSQLVLNMKTQIVQIVHRPSLPGSGKVAARTFNARHPGLVQNADRIPDLPCQRASLSLRVLFRRSRIEHRNVNRVLARKRSDRIGVARKTQNRIHIRCRSCARSGSAIRQNLVRIRDVRTGFQPRIEELRSQNSEVLNLAKLVLHRLHAGTVLLNRNKARNRADVLLKVRVTDRNEALTNRLGRNVRRRFHNLRDEARLVLLEVARNLAEVVQRNFRLHRRTGFHAARIEHVRAAHQSVEVKRLKRRRRLLGRKTGELIQNRILVRVLNYVGELHDTAVLLDRRLDVLVLRADRVRGDALGKRSCRQSKRLPAAEHNRGALVLRNRLHLSESVKNQTVAPVAQKLSADMPGRPVANAAVRRSRSVRSAFVDDICHSMSSFCMSVSALLC
nr:MAG TPA: hypothetical protein [Bacteriophage sp.]